MGNRTTLLFALILGAITILFHLKIKQQEKYYTSMVTALNDSARLWKEESGAWRAQKKAVIVSPGDLKSILPETAKKIKKDLNIRPKNVTAFVEATLSSQDSLILVRDTGYHDLHGDSALASTFYYNNRWTTVRASIREDSLPVYIEHRDSVAFALSWKYKGLFSSPQLAIDGISYNPTSRIAGLSGLQVTPPRRRLSYGFFAGGAVTPTGLKPVIGAGILYCLSR